jgi:sulfite exporter TauE/SafE
LLAAIRAVPKGRLAETLQYHAARVLTYSALGAIVGLTASVFTLAGIGRLVTIVSGLLMIAFALLELLWQRGIVPRSIAARWSELMNRAYKRTARERRNFATRNLLLGVLNGLLPCGLVTSALMGAVSMGTPTEGALFMAFFGLGTMPLLLALSIAGVSLSCKVRARLRVALPGFALLLGALILLRGMALGVPYISPVAPASTAAHEACSTSSVICR